MAPRPLTQAQQQALAKDIQSIDAAILQRTASLDSLRAGERELRDAIAAKRAELAKVAALEKPLLESLRRQEGELSSSVAAKRAEYGALCALIEEAQDKAGQDKAAADAALSRIREEAASEAELMRRADTELAAVLGNIAKANEELASLRLQQDEYDSLQQLMASLRDELAAKREEIARASLEHARIDQQAQSLASFVESLGEREASLDERERIIDVMERRLMPEYREAFGSFNNL